MTKIEAACVLISFPVGCVIGWFGTKKITEKIEERKFKRSIKENIKIMSEVMKEES